jgi:hypothetical protein
VIFPRERRKNELYSANKRLLLVKLAVDLSQLGFETEIDYKKCKILIV